ncbi:MAG: DNA-directed RNA polymerase subunit beta [candidate division WOR-3 bacterium]
MIKDFSKRQTFLEIPNLLAIQQESFRSFLQIDTPWNERKNEGLEALFRETLNIAEPRKNFQLEYVGYILDRPKYTPEEAVEKKVSYTIPLKVIFRLVKKEADSGRVKDVIEEEVFLCELPNMTENGTFIINGIERVVISQLHRSPGLYFSRQEDEHSALLIPLRGVWVEFVIDKNNTMAILLDRRRRIGLGTFLQAIGYSYEDVIARLFPVEEKPLRVGQIIAKSIYGDIENKIASESQTIKRKNREQNASSSASDKESASEHLSERPLLAHIGEEVSEQLIGFLNAKGINKAYVVNIPENNNQIKEKLTILINTFENDKIMASDDAVKKIYTRLRGIVPHSLEVARTTILGMLFDQKRFDLGKVGRYKLNERIASYGQEQTKSNKRITDSEAFTPEDIFLVIDSLLDFKVMRKLSDDIDHLANRRVRRVGELLENQFRNALLQLVQNIKERSSYLDSRKITPNELINSKVVANAISKFFSQNPLSQFMEQTNPLAELTHKRRISALGPGGLTKETAGFEVRDVHYSHYGRICPIETPEGPNIGLITTIATYAQIDEYGFLTTPYWKVKDGIVTKQVVYLNPQEEESAVIAQANAPVDEERRIVGKEVICRHQGDIITMNPESVQYMDISPKQLFAPSTVLIPFLEHDDADRALMGANMQRQAVPLLVPEKPVVATGVEAKFAVESGAVVCAQEDGKVMKVDAASIVLRTEGGLKEYRLKKFMKTNQYTCFNQRPVVKLGQKVKKGDLLADGPSTDEGQLGLGRNVLVAYIPWRGYNYEDAIVISEDLIKEDKFTSIQILEFEIQARETKLGPEEITRDIPGVTEKELQNLDEFGIIRVGAEVTPGDILVGRITPKGETEFTPEEKLLRAIFGEKAANVRDTSLRVEPGVSGVVIDRKILSRHDNEPLTRRLEAEKIVEIKQKYEMRKAFLSEQFDEKIKSILINEKAETNVRDNKDNIILKSGEKFTEEFFSKFRPIKIKNLQKVISDEKKLAEIEQILSEFNKMKNLFDKNEKEEIERVSHGDELPRGVLKSVTIFIAQKRRLSVGDKMAGRHGNKGVVSKILPREDMPYLEDGTPVEIVLNPLGVPSRMNIGQILECHLGWAAKILGYQAVCPVFEGPSIEDIKNELKLAGLPEDGKVTLYDGRTGLPFDKKVVVGYIYMMKLVHMVDDKIHARSTGNYSLITQQPLGGKAQFGGQRFGEMEVWALEAYGAAHALQEMLTIKSDDVEGRSALYNALIRGENPPSPKIPASFSVLVKELAGLGLELIPEKEKDETSKATETKKKK